MYNIPAVVTLRDHIARGPNLRSDTLRAEVCAVVDHLKSAGWPPERVLVAVKRIADDAGLRPSPGVLAAYRPLSEGDAILVQMVQWVIEEYFRNDEKADGLLPANPKELPGAVADELAPAADLEDGRNWSAASP